MKNIQKFLMLSLLTSVNFIHCSTTATAITSAAKTWASGTTKGFKIKLNSGGTAYEIDSGGSDNVWTNTLTTPVQLVTQIGSATAKKDTVTVAAGATTTMTGSVYTATVSQAGNAATKQATTAGAGGGVSKGGSAGVGGGASKGGSAGVGGGASKAALATAQQSSTTTTAS